MQEAGEHVDTQHLESMTPALGYVTGLNAASCSVYIFAARKIAAQRMTVSSEGFEAAEATRKKSG